MKKEYVDEMRKFMDDVISAEKSAGSVIDKKEAELELREQLYREFYYVNREMILFQFYDYLLRSLFGDVEKIYSIEEFNEYAFNIYIKKDGENVFVRTVKDEDFNPIKSDEFVISRDAYKRKFYNMELPELEGICEYYLGNSIYGELKGVLENILKSSCVSISHNEEKYIVGNNLGKSVREIKDLIINQMEYCERWVIDGYEQLERYKKAKEQKKKQAQKTKTRKLDDEPSYYSKE